MAHTYHHHNRSHCARPYAKEGKGARRATARALRREARALCRDFTVGRRDFDAVLVPRPVGTQGWLTH